MSDRGAAAWWSGLTALCIARACGVPLWTGLEPGADALVIGLSVTAATYYILKVIRP